MPWSRCTSVPVASISSARGSGPNSDTTDVSKGPIAVLEGENKERCGLTLHACWLPEARSAPSVERMRFSQDVCEADLANLSDDLKQVVREVGREIDEELGYL